MGANWQVCSGRSRQLMKNSWRTCLHRMMKDNCHLNALPLSRLLFVNRTQAKEKRNLKSLILQHCKHPTPSKNCSKSCKSKKIATRNLLTRKMIKIRQLCSSKNRYSSLKKKRLNSPRFCLWFHKRLVHSLTSQTKIILHPRLMRLSSFPCTKLPVRKNLWWSSQRQTCNLHQY